MKFKTKRFCDLVIGEEFRWHPTPDAWLAKRIDNNSYRYNLFHQTDAKGETCLQTVYLETPEELTATITDTSMTGYSILVLKKPTDTHMPSCEQTMPTDIAGYLKKLVDKDQQND